MAINISIKVNMREQIECLYDNDNGNDHEEGKKWYCWRQENFWRCALMGKRRWDWPLKRRLESKNYTSLAWRYESSEKELGGLRGKEKMWICHLGEWESEWTRRTQDDFKVWRAQWGSWSSVSIETKVQLCVVPLALSGRTGAISSND